MARKTANFARNRYGTASCCDAIPPAPSLASTGLRSQAVTSSRKITRQIQVKGDLDSAKSHSAQDPLISGAPHQTTERCSAFLLVLDCATSIMKLEKLKLKQKNESNCVQVGGHRFSVWVVVRRVLLNLMNKFSIQHSSRRMQNVDCSCSDFKHFNLAFHSLPAPSKLLTLHDCRSRTCSSNQQKLALSRAVAAADAPACMARQKLLRGGCSNKTPMIKRLNTHIHLCDSKCGGKFSQLDLFSFFEEFKVSTFLEARFTGFLTHIETCPCMH